MTAWEAFESDLESGVADVATATRLCKEEDCPKHLRRLVWPLLLGVRGKPDTITPKTLSVPEDGELLDACRTAADKLKSEHGMSVEAGDMVKVIVVFCQARGVTTDHAVSNGWIELLLPFFGTGMAIGDVYNCFYAFVSKFALRDTQPDSACFHMFRLLLLYHEPEFCLFLDSAHISMHDFLLPWFQSLFATACPGDIALKLWDKYIAHGDPFLVFFLALVFVINAKDYVVDLGSDTTAAVEFLSSLPAQVSPDDLGDLIDLGLHYSSLTPDTLRSDYFAHVFGVGGSPTAGRGFDDVMQLLCFDVSPAALLKRIGERSLFLVDTRPTELYTAGHLTHTSKHLDAKRLLHDPAAVDEDLAALEHQLEHSAQQHICFMGSTDDDDLLKMLISRCLKRHLMHVTCVRGGYSAVFDHIKAIGKLDQLIQGNAVETSARAQSDPLAEESAVVPHVEDKQPTRFGARFAGWAASYKVPSELIAHIGKAAQESNIVRMFQCNEVHASLLYPTHLALTRSHILKLREIEGRGNHAVVMWRRPLTSILRITAKKKHPTLLSFLFTDESMSEEAIAQAMARAGIVEQPATPSEAGSGVAASTTGKDDMKAEEGQKQGGKGEEHTNKEEEEEEKGEEAAPAATAAFAIDDDDEEEEKKEQEQQEAEEDQAENKEEDKETVAEVDKSSKTDSVSSNAEAATSPAEEKDVGGSVAKPAAANTAEAQAQAEAEAEAKQAASQQQQQQEGGSSGDSSSKKGKKPKIDIPGTLKERFLVPQAQEAKAVLRDMIVAAREEEDRLAL
ncbi:hypothetical protein PTSG_05569 [Salpingoeca rosetta]|uniref:Rab-GAP TBC domain-containing protein n=1 Tax=Salpingoeca rosetta (strain ATCC 50818 / BSB-021) TaxID=946362 RepID=F2UBK8_SALR5|nr:uncharacterized protein PTSG_05569 [Salpingoeca rosetta]EGD73874.1 hypothetical protein PTSG_05569 [Salpingoeca rosetta]|eukprot:XP_004993437.1 hypothetical protein PTSG_05569 [Salpingoeca rosetta]